MSHVASDESAYRLLCVLMFSSLDLTRTWLCLGVSIQLSKPSVSRHHLSPSTFISHLDGGSNFLKDPLLIPLVYFHLVIGSRAQKNTEQ